MPSYRFDVTQEGGNPDVMISIDGLDEQAMKSYWDISTANRAGKRKSGFDAVAENCSTQVANVLKAGGAERLVSAPNHTMWSPARVEAWAKEIASRSKQGTNAVFRDEGIVNGINGSLRRLQSEIGTAILPLMSPRDW